jgi:CxxC-x17-CxxC domain-containing protein
MSDFHKERRFSGGRDFKKRDFSKPQEMHPAVCSECGKDCQVPFRPSGDKPVYCRDCFQNKRDARPRSYNDRPRDVSTRPSGENYKEQFERLDVKLDKILNLLAVKEVIQPKVEEVEVKVEPKAKVVKKKPSKKSKS